MLSHFSNKDQHAQHLSSEPTGFCSSTLSQAASKGTLDCSTEGSAGGGLSALPASHQGSRNTNGNESPIPCPALTFELLQAGRLKAFPLGHTKAVQEFTFAALTAGISSPLLSNIPPVFEAPSISMITRAHRSVTISFLNTMQSPQCYQQFKDFPSPLPGKTLQNSLMYLPGYDSYCFFGEHTELAIKSLYTSQVIEIKCLKTCKIIIDKGKTKARTSMILLQKHPATVFNTKTVTESLFLFFFQCTCSLLFHLIYRRAM